MHVHHDKDPKFHPSKGKPNFSFSFLIFLKLVASFDIPFCVFSWGKRNGNPYQKFGYN
jgi:hypothetical protein